MVFGKWFKNKKPEFSGSGFVFARLGFFGLELKAAQNLDVS